MCVRVHPRVAGMRTPFTTTTRPTTCGRSMSACRSRWGRVTRSSRWCVDAAAASMTLPPPLPLPLLMLMLMRLLLLQPAACNARPVANLCGHVGRGYNV